MTRRVTAPELRAALWTVRGLRSVRHQLRHQRVDQVRLRLPSRLPANASRGVYAVLRRQRHSCLERALVLQRWYASQGQHREVVIGVTGPHDFLAHAWLEGETTCHDSPFAEIMRLPAP